MSAHIISDFFREYFLEAGDDSPVTFAGVSLDGKRFELPFPAAKQGVFFIKNGDLEFEITMNFHPEFDAIEWLTRVINRSDKPSPMVSDISVMDITIPMPVDAKVLHKGLRGDSRTGETFLPFENEITSGQTVGYQPVGAKPSHHAFPFFDICGEEDGLICAIGWGATWRYTIERTDKELILKAGLPKARFYVKPGEQLRLPRILLMGYKNGYRDAHNRFRRLMRDHYSPKMRFGDKMRMPIALQNYDRYTFTVEEWNGEAAQLQTIDFAEKCGFCNTYWMDAIWFNKGFFGGGIGNYTFRESFPDGLARISDYAHEKGLRMLVWAEPERVYYDTDVATEHPEFLLRSTQENRIWKPGTRWKGGNQPGMMYNLAKPEAVDWMIENLCNFIEKNGIDIYRQDYSIYANPFFEENDEENREGITEIKYVEGEYRLLDALLARFPHLMIDNCSGGGNRIELETHMRCVFCWRSDTGCDRETAEKRSSVWNQNHMISLSNYIVYHSICTWEPRSYDVRSAMSNGIAVNFDVFNESFDFENAKRLLAECDRIGKYWEDDVYPQTKADLAEDHWSICQFGTAESGVVMVFRREQASEARQMLKLQALDAEMEYLLRITDDAQQTTEVSVSGAVLAEGYEVYLAEPRSSLVVEYLRQ